MQYLAERNIGYFARVAHVPIVPAAIIFDLSFKDSAVRPDKAFGYKACEAASSAPLAQGSVGAGTGATVGKLFGMEHAVKSGVGSAATRCREGITVGALAVVNNLGDVLDVNTGAILAGTRHPQTGVFVDTARTLAQVSPTPPVPWGENTNLVVIATDGRLDKAGANKLARMAAAGMARVLRPCHSTFDGDMVFAFSTGDRPADVNRLGVLAADLTALAINRAVLTAEGLGVLPTARDRVSSRSVPPAD
jgi:L-aminopeptidase/D-esterase-like protein